MRLRIAAQGKRLRFQRSQDIARSRGAYYASICGLLCIVALLQLALWPAVIAAKGGLGPYVRITTDFLPTLMGGQIIRDGRGDHLYDREAQREALRQLVSPYLTTHGDTMNIYNHPPAEALLAALLSNLPAEVIFWIWTALAMLAFGASLSILAWASPLPRPILWIAVLASASYHPVHLSWWLGQNTTFVLLGVCCLYAGRRRRHDGLAAIGLALLILKPQLLPAVGILLLLERRWRMIAIATAILSGLTVTAIPILGVAWPVRYARYLLIDSNQGQVVAEKPMVMHNWRGFAVNLLDHRAPTLVTLTFVVLSIFSLGLLLFAWWSTRQTPAAYQNTTRSERDDLLFALSCVSTLLISVHLNPHDLTLLIVPAWIVSGYLVAKRWAVVIVRIWTAIIWIGYALPFPTYYTTATEVLPVVSSVSLMALVTVLLAWQAIKPSVNTDSSNEAAIPNEDRGQLTIGIRFER